MSTTRSRSRDGSGPRRHGKKERKISKEKKRKMKVLELKLDKNVVYEINAEFYLINKVFHRQNVPFKTVLGAC